MPGFSSKALMRLLSGLVALASTVQPFLTIGRAAELARPGDTVTVREGIYRECVNPRRGGTSDDKRIVYRAAGGEDVRIVGSERVTAWERDGRFWKVSIEADFFGEANPCAESIRHPEPVAADPNVENAEISVRPCAIYPTAPGLGLMSSVSDLWAHNPFVDTWGFWLDQDFQDRPRNRHARWLNNLFVRGSLGDRRPEPIRRFGLGVYELPRAADYVLAHNVYLDGARADGRIL